MSDVIYYAIGDVHGEIEKLDGLCGGNIVDRQQVRAFEERRTRFAGH